MSEKTDKTSMMCWASCATPIIHDTPQRTVADPGSVGYPTDPGYPTEQMFARIAKEIPQDRGPHLNPAEWDSV